MPSSNVNGNINLNKFVPNSAFNYQHSNQGQIENKMLKSHILEHVKPI
jgi:hypothetical protein